MQSLPMVPGSCSLSETELAAQAERYRALARHVRAHRRDGTRLAVILAAEAPTELIADAIATERSCCPSLALDWDPAARRLVIDASAQGDEQVLELITDALGLPCPYALRPGCTRSTTS